MTEQEKLLTDIFRRIIIENKRHLGQGVEDLNVMIATNPDGVLKNLSMLSKEDQQTPPAVIEKMIDIAGWRLPDGTLDTTKIYLDPCCGRGGILAYLHKHYNIPKENLYGIDIKQENVALCTKLGFNVIKRSALEAQSYIEIRAKIKKIKGDDMEINRVLMNPPYDGNLHLKVLETTLKAVKQNNPACEVVSIQPARWLEDPLAEYKQGSDYKKYKITVANKISNLQIIKAADATRLFKIDTGSDLAIYTFIDQPANKLQINTVDVRTIINKVITKTKVSLADLIEEGAVNGWRCEIKEMLPEGGSHSAGDSQYPKTCGVKVVLGPYNNGLDSNGVLFSEARSKNGREKDYFRYSIAFDNEITAQNFASSHTSTFYKNLIQIMKYDQHAPLRFLPYMEDYSKAWTDEDYCKFFDLTEEESEFMCRKVDDYRVKDFINYINLDVE